MTEESAFQSLRPLMFAIAYRMLGRVTEAEDIVQEAFLRYHRAVASGSFARARPGRRRASRTRPRPTCRP